VHSNNEAATLNVLQYYHYSKDKYHTTWVKQGKV